MSFKNIKIKSYPNNSKNLTCQPIFQVTNTFTLSAWKIIHVSTFDNWESCELRKINIFSLRSQNY